ncbi:MAG TPA: ABC transporter ATP-binding protein [Longimicrobiales bacterium]|nr:ABC transporter ATP-binding protein [Longimicrobiales bacterium]
MNATEAPVLRARALVKRFGSLTAVNGLDLELERGTCLALLGPNGAGKTTTIEMFEGLQRPDEGEIEILGRTWASDPDGIRERIGVQLQETRLQEKITVWETLRLFRSFYRQGRDLAEVLDVVGLADKRDARVETLSGGQHQRLSLACALVSRPELLFLDEPTTGLDPQARRRVWEIVQAFRSEGGTILLTTHYMEEAERLADRVVIVDAGRVIARGTPASVIASLHAESIVQLHPRNGTGERLLDAALRALPGVGEVRREGAAFTLVVTDTQASVAALLRHLSDLGVELESLQTHSPTLEDVFVALTGKHLRDG